MVDGRGDGMGWSDEGLSSAICTELRATAEDSNAFALCAFEMKKHAIDVMVLEKQCLRSREAGVMEVNVKWNVK